MFSIPQGLKSLILNDHMRGSFFHLIQVVSMSLMSMSLMHELLYDVSFSRRIMLSTCTTTL